MENVAALKVAQQLNATINQLYEETIQRLEAALQSVCNDFHSKQYVKVCAALDPDQTAQLLTLTKVQWYSQHTYRGSCKPSMLQGKAIGTCVVQ